VEVTSFRREILISILQLALISALILAALSIYHRLPPDPSLAEQVTEPTLVTLALRGDAWADAVPAEIQIDLYPLDLTAVQREFVSERRAGVRFDDFLEKKLNGQKPVKVKMELNGESSVRLAPGRWWLYATMPGPVTTEWRLTLNVSGRRQTVELTPANIYARSQSF
jgi:hypothetical protein